MGRRTPPASANRIRLGACSSNSRGIKAYRAVTEACGGASTRTGSFCGSPWCRTAARTRVAGGTPTEATYTLYLN